MPPDKVWKTIMDNKNKIIREYTCELIRACFEKRAPYEIPEGITAKELLDISISGQIQYPIASSLLKLQLEEEQAERARNLLRVSTFKTFAQVGALSRITKVFEENGIRHQALKGAVTKRIYPSPEMREMSDLDIVVFDESLDRAAGLLEEMGYKNHGLVKHHMIFSGQGGVHVELHWCLFDQNADRKQFIYFKDNFKSVLKEGTAFTYEFGVDDFYVYMISHMSKHFFETGCGIRNLLDIYVYRSELGDRMNNEYLAGELEKCGIRDFEKNMKELAFIWMENRECSEFFENLFAYMVDSGIYGKTENGVWGQLAKETAADGSGSKLHYYFPSLEFMKEKYPWLSRMPVLLPAAWVIRGVSGISRKESRDHRDKIEHTDSESIRKMMEIYHELNLNFRR